MKKYLYIAIAIGIAIVGGIITYQRSEIKKYKNLYNKELQNVEAYRISNSNLEGKVYEFKMTMDDLRASKDSIDMKLVEAIEKLKIKDKKIEYLQYQAKTIHKTDTVHFSDTLFIPTAHVDTILGDKWYNIRLKLDYPSTIVASPTFNSEQYVVINSKKEYNKKPSKIFFIRWFQKKHWVTEVNVIERNPYIGVKQQKYIKVVK